MPILGGHRETAVTKCRSDGKTGGPTLDLSKPDTDSPERRLAREMLRPTVSAAITVYAFNKGSGDLPLTELVHELAHQVHECANGKLERGEAMLVAQMHSLDTLFNALVQRGIKNAEGGYTQAAETYLRLGLKAQAQGRAAIETLANIKNPRPVAYVQQANIAHGPQQVNNGPQPAEARPTRETQNPPNKLLEQQRNESLDARPTEATIGTDSGLEAVGAVHRTKDSDR